MKPRDRENKRYTDGFVNPIGPEEKILFDFLKGCPRGRMLDVGCGVGTHAAVMVDAGFDVVGLDFSPVAIVRAGELGVRVLAADADLSLPFKNSSFKYVWATDVLEHVFDPVGLIKEIVRVLTPDGRLLLTVPNNVNLVSRATTFFSGRSPQSSVYRRFGQYKHHTLFSLELLKYMLVDGSRFNFDFLCAISHTLKCVIRVQYLAALLGSTFVAVCSKK